ncbi:Sugar (and other) transporter [Geosmithia morbida]|uniref:Sugar (And other) transporter n=1 Tax=Geosmithia morbida TaxID=1094350 RepID=A0A9P4YRU8_9HYPO|nr:Sugar (and other) transporter [Geosmithia morbida]KAF4119864.1 Sugar (and other) transporter [Geosmithia morbida]
MAHPLPGPWLGTLSAGRAVAGPFSWSDSSPWFVLPHVHAPMYMPEVSTPPIQSATRPAEAEASPSPSEPWSDTGSSTAPGTRTLAGHAVRALRRLLAGCGAMFLWQFMGCHCSCNAIACYVRTMFAQLGLEGATSGLLAAGRLRRRELARRLPALLLLLLDRQDRPPSRHLPLSLDNVDAIVGAYIYNTWGRSLEGIDLVFGDTAAHEGEGPFG